MVIANQQDPRAELELLRKQKRLRELESKATASQRGADGVPEMLRRPANQYDGEGKPIVSSPQPQSSGAQPFRHFGDFAPILDQDTLPGATAADKDIGTGIATAPLRAARGAGKGFESAGNFGRELVAQTGFDPRLFVNDEQGFHLYKNMGKDGPKPFSFAEQIPKGAESVTGDLTEGLSQWLAVRGAVGKAMPGGGMAPQLGKDILSTGMAFDGDSGRVSDMIASDTPVIGGLADMLRTREGDSPLMGRAKNMGEDVAMSLPPIAALRGLGAIPEVANALRPRAASGAPPPRPAQPGHPGAGQQAAGPLPILNATPQAAPVAQGGVSLAKSDAKIIGRLLRSGGVAGNDVNNVLSGLVQAYNRSDSSRTRLALFAEDYLPTVLPPEVADRAIAELRNFGNAANTSVKDGRQAIVQRNVGQLRGSQEDYLSGVFEDNLGDTSLRTTKGKIRGDKTLNADAVYKRELDAGQQRLAAGKATQKEMDARDTLLTRVGQKSFFDKVPDELKFAAENDPNVGGLWEYIHQRPLEASHWLQSKLGSMARKGGDNAGLYHEMRMALLRPLEDAVPGYRGARLKHGDLVGQEIAVEFGDDLFRAAAGELSAAEKAADFKKLSKSQQTVAKRSIRDKLKNEFRKSKTATGRVDPATGKPLDTRAAYMTKLQQDGVLDTLEEILGADGRRIAEAIRSEARLNDRLPSYGSDTKKNLAGAEAAREAVQSPFNKVVGDVGDTGGWLPAIAGDAFLMSTGLPPIMTPGKIGAKIVDKFGNPSKKALASATETLYGRPPPAARNALAAPRAPAPRRAPPVKQPATPELLEKLLKQYDGLNHGRAPVASDKLAKRIVRVRKELEALPAPAPTNALGPPPRKPVQNGFLPSRPKAEAPVGGTPEALARAKADGFDVDTPLYHGTPDSRGVWSDGFKTPKEKYGANDPERVYFFSEDRHTASTYADDKRAFDYQNAEPETIPVYLRMKNPKVIEWNGRPFRGREKDGSGYAIRDYIDQARTEGHDGVIIKNVIDTYDGKGKPTNIRAVFDPSNIRSPKAAFDPTKKDSSRLLDSMGGNLGRKLGSSYAPEIGGGVVGGAAGYYGTPEEAPSGSREINAALGGVLGMPLGRALANRAPMARNALSMARDARRGPDQMTFGGIRAKTADKAKLATAERMEKAGASRDDIWDETGWFKGVDGKWRFEIDDSGAKYRGPLTERGEIPSGMSREKTSGKLPEFLSDATAGGAYPDLKKARVSVNRGIGEGGYSRGEMSPRVRTAPDIISTYANDGAETRSVLLHERQHGIQDREGFASGGSPYQAVVDHILEIEAKIKTTLDDLLEAGEMGEVPALWAVRDRLKELNVQLATAKSGAGAMKRYGNLAGETEARNVQARRNFTPAERKAKRPWETQDVPDDQQIVRFGSDGVRMSSSAARKLDPIEPQGRAETKPAQRLEFKGGGGGGRRGGPSGPPKPDLVPDWFRYTVGGGMGGATGAPIGGMAGSAMDLDGDGVKGTAKDQQIGSQIGMAAGASIGGGVAGAMKLNALSRAAKPSGMAVEKAAERIIGYHGIRRGLQEQAAVIKSLKASGASADRLAKAERILEAIKRRGRDTEATLSGQAVPEKVVRLGPPKAADAPTKANDNYSPARDLQEAKRFNKEKLTPERAKDWADFLRTENDPVILAKELGVDINPSVLARQDATGERMRGMVERIRRAALEKVTPPKAEPKRPPPAQNSMFGARLGGKKPPKELTGEERMRKGLPMTKEDAEDYAVLFRDHATMPKHDLADLLGLGPGAPEASLRRMGAAKFEEAKALGGVKSGRKETVMKMIDDGAADEDIARAIGLDPANYDAKGLRNLLNVFDAQVRPGGRSATALARLKPPKRPPPVQNSMFGARLGGKRGEPPVWPEKPTAPEPRDKRRATGPSHSPRVIRALDEAANRLPKEARDRIAANALLPPSQRVSAMEASHTDPSMFGVAAPFQRKGSSLDANISHEVGRLNNIVARDPLAATFRRYKADDAATLTRAEFEAAEAEFKKASSAHTRAKNKYVMRDDRETYTQPAFERMAAAEKRMAAAAEARTSAQDALAAAKLDETELPALKDWANRRLQQITEAMRERTPDIGGLPKFAPTLPGAPKGARPPKVKGGSKREAEELARLLFDKEQAKLLDEVLSGKVRLKEHSNHHYAVALTAAGGVGALTVGYTLERSKENAEKTAIAAGRTPKRNFRGTEPDPRWSYDWERQQNNNAEITTIQSWLNAAGGYKLKTDGHYNRQDGKVTNTQKALRHWRAENNFDPDSPFTEEERDLLEQQALEAMRSSGTR
jgi:hypothetical protein